MQQLQQLYSSMQQLDMRNTFLHTRCSNRALTLMVRCRNAGEGPVFWARQALRAYVVFCSLPSSPERLNQV